MKNKVTQKQIDNIIKHSRIDVKTVFNKVTLVTCKLPNGFVLVESSGAVDKKNYDEDMGKEICMDHIESKIWELEGYYLAKLIYQKKQSNSGSLYGMMSATQGVYK
ncbi:Gp49 family protein [Companilactobacillus keshanensis]|uniref:Gp49 family protein n=1 Tax=Companilactobacillus keshanensis TaxID=2486003 RepID=A0ABW4BUX3_9LACO|nr:Gp49 family protein [Companilactobacillus keshanensis]